MSSTDNMTALLSSGNFTDYNSSLSYEDYDYHYPYGGCNQMVHFHQDLTQILSVRVTLVVCYIIVATLATLGNMLVIWTVWRNSHMHTVTNYYIVNLAISDFLVASIVMPLKLLEWTAECSWQVFRTDALCSVVTYLLPIFVFTSVLTLVAISIERYYAIVHPLSAMKINSKSRTRKIIALTWVIPFIVASPYVFCRTYAFTITSQFGTISRQICNDRFDEIDIAIYGNDPSKEGSFRKGYFAFIFFMIYLLPSIVILTTCIKIAISLLQPITVENSVMRRRKEKGTGHEENKRKVARMVIVIAVTFIVSWSPQYIVTIISQLQTHSFLRESNFLFTMLLTHLFGFFNSCLNPFIYCAMSQRFRRSFKEVIYGIVCCGLYRSGIPARFLFRQASSNRTRFTSTLRHVVSETDNNTIIALNDCMHNNIYMSRKGESKSSSSGTDSDKLSYTRDNKCRKIVTMFMGKRECETASPTDSETQVPLIKHSVPNGRCPSELRGILKNSPTQRRTKDYSTCMEFSSLHAGSNQDVKHKDMTEHHLHIAEDDTCVSQNSVCLLQDENMKLRAKYTNRS